VKFDSCPYQVILSISAVFRGMVPDGNQLSGFKGK